MPEQKIKIFISLFLINSFLIHSFFIHSFIHISFFLLIPFIHSFTHSFFHSLTHSFFHSLTHSLIHSFIHSFLTSQIEGVLIGLQVKVPAGYLGVVEIFANVRERKGGNETIVGIRHKCEGPAYNQ